MGHTSTEQRWSIINKWKETGSVPDTARELGLLPQVVHWWVQRYEDTGDVKDAPKSGRRPALTHAAAQKAHDLLLSHDGGSAKAVARQLHEGGFTSTLVDKKTVTRAVRKLGRERGVPIVALRGRPRNQLSQLDRDQRQQFSRKNRGRSWASVMFTDRKQFHFTFPKQRIHAVTWAEKGTRREAHAVSHPQGVNVYAGITKYGMTRLHAVTGTSNLKTDYMNVKGEKSRNITAQEYTEVLRRTLLPEGRRIFSGQGMGTWTLQQDNDPAHSAASSVLREWNSKHYSSVGLIRNWPPHSPDLSPIENLWGYLQSKMDARGCRTFSEYKAALKEEARAVRPEYFSNLVKGMPKRVAKCIELGGGEIPH